jgi:hypothetical protein
MDIDRLSNVVNAKYKSNEKKSKTTKSNDIPQMHVYGSFSPDILGKRYGAR